MLGRLLWKMQGIAADALSACMSVAWRRTKMTTLISRRKALSVIGGGAAAGVIADTSIPQAHAQGRPFTWASTGGTWGETIKRVFVDPFAQAVSLQPAHSAQLESVAVSK